MNSDLENLLATLRSVMGNNGNSGALGQAMSNLPTGGSGQVLNHVERLARGIDPRDPNKYMTLPNGNIVGTLMGWDGMGRSPMTRPDGQSVGGRPTEPQASASQGGKYRLSPGVYGTREQAMQKYQNDMNNWNNTAGAVGNNLGQFLSGAEMQPALSSQLAGVAAQAAGGQSNRAPSGTASSAAAASRGGTGPRRDPRRSVLNAIRTANPNTNAIPKANTKTKGK